MMTDHRTVYCGQVTKNNLDTEIKLCGWVSRRRDHGGVIFIDLRDRTGFCQIVFNPEWGTEAATAAHALRSEFVISVVGTLVNRAEIAINPKIAMAVFVENAGFGGAVAAPIAQKILDAFFHNEKYEEFKNPNKILIPNDTTQRNSQETIPD